MQSFSLQNIQVADLWVFLITGAKILPVWCQQDKAGARARFPGSPPQQGARMESETRGSRQGHHRAEWTKQAVQVNQWGHEVSYCSKISSKEDMR